MLDDYKSFAPKEPDEPYRSLTDPDDQDLIDLDEAINKVASTHDWSNLLSLPLNCLYSIIDPAQMQALLIAFFEEPTHPDALESISIALRSPTLSLPIDQVALLVEICLSIFQQGGMKDLILALGCMYRVDRYLCDLPEPLVRSVVDCMSAVWSEKCNHSEFPTAAFIAQMKRLVKFISPDEAATLIQLFGAVRYNWEVMGRSFSLLRAIAIKFPDMLFQIIDQTQIVNSIQGINNLFVLTKLFKLVAVLIDETTAPGFMQDGAFKTIFQKAARSLNVSSTHSEAPDHNSKLFIAAVRLILRMGEFDHSIANEFIATFFVQAVNEPWLSFAEQRELVGIMNTFGPVVADEALLAAVDGIFALCAIVVDIQDNAVIMSTLRVLARLRENSLAITEFVIDTFDGIEGDDEIYTFLDFLTH